MVGLGLVMFSSFLQPKTDRDLQHKDLSCNRVKVSHQQPSYQQSNTLAYFSEHFLNPLVPGLFQDSGIWNLKHHYGGTSLGQREEKNQMMIHMYSFSRVENNQKCMS